MLAIQAPPATALITPARRDSPRPAATVRSASGPRPKTSRLPSGIPTTSPDGVLTRAATEEGDRFSITFLPVDERCTAPGSEGDVRGGAARAQNGQRRNGSASPQSRPGRPAG